MPGDLSRRAFQRRLRDLPCPPGPTTFPPHTKPNPALANTWTWFSRGDSSYNALQVDVNRRFSQGLSLRGVYTWSKALDDGDSLNATTANNAPGLVSNPFNLRADWGLATYDVRNMGVVSAVYELPFGRGKALANNLERLEQQAGERMVGEQHRHAAVGLPVHAAAQLQPIEQRRHAQSGAAVRQSELQRPGDPGNSRRSGSIPLRFSRLRPTAASTATWDGIRSSDRGSPRGIFLR